MRLKSLRDMLRTAHEWADELSQFRGYEPLIAPLVGAAFEEEVIKRGRDPDVVLKELRAKIAEKINAHTADVHVPGVQPPLGGHTLH